MQASKLLSNVQSSKLLSNVQSSKLTNNDPAGKLPINVSSGKLTNIKLYDARGDNSLISIRPYISLMPKGMVLDKNIEVTPNGLGLYLSDIDAIVVADMHIGLELALLDEGTFFPMDQYTTMKQQIFELVEVYTPKILIINGDFKHEFGRASFQEWYEVLDLWDALEDVGVALEIVRGNHDNYLITVLKQRDHQIRDPFYQKGRYMFAHGHKEVAIEEICIDKSEVLIIGHEHPAIALRDETKGRHKFKCFLVGKWNKLKIIVVPALSPMFTGSIINSSITKCLFSPISREIKIDEFRPVVADRGELLWFPPLAELDKIDIRDDPDFVLS